MKNLNIENLGLSELGVEESKEVTGGFISYLSFIPKTVELVVTEVADFIDGIASGYKYVRNQDNQ